MACAEKDERGVGLALELEFELEHRERRTLNAEWYSSGNHESPVQSTVVDPLDPAEFPGL